MTVSYPVAAAIAVEKTAISFDKLYDYLIPEELASQVSLGCRVLVAFGAGGKKRQGIVFKLYDSIPDESVKLKNISSVLDGEAVLSKELLSLAMWLSERTFCPIFDTARSFMPSGAYLKIIRSYKLIAAPIDYEDNDSLTSNMRDIISCLKRKDDFIPSEKIAKQTGIEDVSSELEALSKMGLVLCNADTQRRIGDAVIKMVSLKAECLDNDIPIKLTKKQESVISLLKTVGSATTKEITYFTGTTQAVIENLYKKGFLEYSDIEIYRSPERISQAKPDRSEIILSDEQGKVYNRLREHYESNESRSALLFGVTGSGKTKVYMKLIDEIAAKGEGVIVLVPEIALTPQLMSMFYARYGDRVAVVHSRLSVGERYDEWKRIKRGHANIVIGTRSAVFAPLENIRLIVVDEEQESSYKSEMSPRYHARDVARFRCNFNKALLVLASATPAVETYAAAVSGQYELLKLSQRYSKAGLPEVLTVDMSVKENITRSSVLSDTLLDELNENIKFGKQSILLINRRGFNTFVACTKCKNVITCPNCSISMTYHSANNRMMCHYCGYSEEMVTTCPQCGEQAVRFSGFGTQRVCDELSSFFPSASILRMDADTVGGKNSHEECFDAFKNGDYDILVGTQMVAKGLDFPNVTLVGVVSVDQQLYNDDYKSSERVFDLLTQVVGRSGRGEDKGRAVIQTLAPENSVIEMAAMQDYNAFYDTEIMIRRAMIYPPYCNICTVSFTAVGELNAKNAARMFFKIFKNLQSEDFPDEKLIILGPVAPKIAKINNQFRERIIIKCKNQAGFRALMTAALKEFSTVRVHNSVKITVDMNPESIF